MHQTNDNRHHVKQEALALGFPYRKLWLDLLKLESYKNI